MASVNLLDDILGALADQDRRFALYYLQEKNEVDVEELARQVAAWKSKKSTADVTEDELQRVLMGFHHNHLEKLRDAECIEYDKRSGAIRCQDGRVNFSIDSTRRRRFRATTQPSATSRD